MLNFHELRLAISTGVGVVTEASGAHFTVP
jgi:hypothetical protein